MNDVSHTCKMHSGIVADIKHNKDTNTAQWKEINGMKKFIMTTLLLVCVTLMGVLLQLAITLAK